MLCVETGKFHVSHARKDEERFDVVGGMMISEDKKKSEIIEEKKQKAKSEPMSAGTGHCTFRSIRHRLYFHRGLDHNWVHRIYILANIARGSHPIIEKTMIPILIASTTFPSLKFRGSRFRETSLIANRFSH